MYMKYHVFNFENRLRMLNSNRRYECIKYPEVKCGDLEDFSCQLLIDVLLQNYIGVDMTILAITTLNVETWS